MTSKRPTLKTISDLSGFAVPTVSRALKDAPDIGESTKRKVREIAAEIGYVPNRAGVRLRTGKTNVISLVMLTDYDVIDDHMGRLISTISQWLRQTPYHMTITPHVASENRMDPVKYVVETRSADAVVLAEIEDEDPRVAYLMERNFPFVTYGRTRWCRDHAYFDFDNGSFGEIAGAKLLERGRRNILLIAPPAGQAYRGHILAGLTRSLQGTDARLEILQGCSSHDTNARMRAAVASRLAAGGPVDAIIAPSKRSAISAVAAVEHHGRVVGQDIDLYAKEASPILQFFRPQIMSVHEDMMDAGAFLAEAAVRAIERPDLPPMQGLAVAQESKPVEALF